MKALLLVDDQTTADVISFYLQREGFEPLATIPVRDRQAALDHLRVESPDLIILDMNFPAADSLVICENIRAQSDIPLIILSPGTEENELIQGLELGADDYIIKPFSPRLMMARIKAVMRRAGPLKTDISLLEVGGLVLDCACRQVRGNDELVAKLTRQESRLLEILIRNSDHMLPSEMLINHIWGPSRGDRLMLKKLVSRLRHKLASGPAGVPRIETIAGAGYRLVSLELVGDK